MVPGGRGRFCKVIPGSSLNVLIVTGRLLMIVVEVVSFPFIVFIRFELAAESRSWTTSGSQDTWETPGREIDINSSNFGFKKIESYRSLLVYTI